MKKFVGAVLSAAMAISLCACGETTEVNVNSDAKVSSTVIEESVSSSDWKNLYADYIINAKDVYAENNDAIHCLSVNDLNFDGVPELVMSGGAASAGCAVNVFGIVDGKVECMVKNNALCSEHEHNHLDKVLDDIGLYIGWSREWLTLRKNTDTGEMIYSLHTTNGSSEESFFNIISFGKDSSDSALKCVNELYNCDFVDPDKNDVYTVSDKNVSKEEFDNKLKQFCDEWQTIDYSVGVMADAQWGHNHPGQVPIVLEKDSLIEFFETYKNEKEFLTEMSASAEEKKLTKDELMEKMCGNYLPVKYMNAYKESKSAQKAFEHRLGVSLYKRADGSYASMVTDLHQGSGEYDIVYSIGFKNGEYTVKLMNKEDYMFLTFVYSPDSNIVNIDGIYHPFWYYDKSAVDFAFYKNEESALNDIAKSIFKDLSSVEFKGDSAYCTINGKQYCMMPILDTIVDIMTDIENPDGYISLKSENDADFIITAYRFENGKLRLVNEDGSIDVTLE